MFTGIIHNTGTIKKRDGESLVVAAPQKLIRNVKKGASIAVNGACLTVVGIDQKRSTVAFDIMPETWQRTALGDLRLEDIVNLECALGASGSFDGHIVQGHVDGTALVRSVKKSGAFYVLDFSVKKELGNYLVEKGSIAIEGISLTIMTAGATQFTVGIIPYTWEHTSLHQIEKGKRVNIEIDIVAKYVQKFLQKSHAKKRK